jgi:DNA excision repair protein ERCC-1
MVDIDNSEESLQELSKTSLVNNVTVMLCWSAQEAGRYLELFKAFEHAAPTSIRAQQSSSYSDKLVEFITVPRSVNKTDALGLVSNFGSIRTAVNAGPEEIGLIAGWGEKKVQRWCSAVREPFRVKKAARRGVSRDNTRATTSKDVYHSVGEELALEDASDARLEARLGIGQALSSGANRRADKRPAEVWESGNNTERAVQEADPRKARKVDSSESANKKTTDEEMSEGVIAALAKLRQQ